MDEACGAAAVRADPESAESFAAAIRDALARRDELRAKGLAHAAQFSWERTGELFLEGYLRFS
jgi:glycosyltransferase involved in cell wall biosynthesis